MHRALLGLFPQREICRSARARGGQHLVLCRKNPHPDIRDHDRAEQGPDVHERRASREQAAEQHGDGGEHRQRHGRRHSWAARLGRTPRSEEHTSELQSLAYLVCRLLLEKKKTEITVDATDAEHGEAIAAAVEAIDSDSLLETTDSTFELHRGGALFTGLKTWILTRDDPT